MGSTELRDRVVSALASWRASPASLNGCGARSASVFCFSFFVKGRPSLGWDQNFRGGPVGSRTRGTLMRLLCYEVFWPKRAQRWHKEISCLQFEVRAAHCSGRKATAMLGHMAVHGNVLTTRNRAIPGSRRPWHMHSVVLNCGSALVIMPRRCLD